MHPKHAINERICTGIAPLRQSRAREAAAW